MHYLKIIAISTILVITGIEANASAVQPAAVNCTGEDISNCIVAATTINALVEIDPPLSQSNAVNLAYLDGSNAISQLSTRDESAKQVTVAEVPLLSVIWLFGAALIGFIGISRRRSF